MSTGTRVGSPAESRTISVYSPGRIEAPGLGRRVTVVGASRVSPPERSAAIGGSPSHPRVSGPIGRSDIRVISAFAAGSPAETETRDGTARIAGTTRP